MELTLIAAMSDRRVIGYKGTVPWKIPADMKRFRELTTGYPIIMGRKTYDSIPDKFRPLPERKNIVISRQDISLPQEVILAKQVGEAISVGQREARKMGKDNVYVIGGEEIYKQTIALATRLEMTQVRGNYEGDAFFPSIDSNKWKVDKLEEIPACIFATYIRK